MGVYLSGFRTVMTQQFLYMSQTGSGLKQIRDMYCLMTCKLMLLFIPVILTGFFNANSASRLFVFLQFPFLSLFVNPI